MLDQLPHHCSPTLVPWIFLPLVPRCAFGVKRAGSNGESLIHLASPSKTSSAMAFPQAGAQAMPLNGETNREHGLELNSHVEKLEVRHKD